MPTLAKGEKMYVSVIIPMYNVAKTVEATLKSLLAQTHSDWEAILVDDGSTDSTLAVAEEYVKADARFRIVRQENAGVCAARNTGINLARYDWLLFLDADDWIVPEHLKLMTQELEVDINLDAVYCGWAFITPDGYEVFRDIPDQTGDLFAIHAEGCPYAIHAFIVSRRVVEAVGGFDPDLIVCEDWDLWQRISRIGARFKAINKMLAPYRMRATSASMDGRRILADGLRVLRQGYSPDLRLSTSIPVYKNGLPTKDRVAQEFYLMCSAAGLVIGRNQDARFLLDELEHENCLTLDPYSAAYCVAQSAMLSACRPLAEWRTVWQQLEPNVCTFFGALEERTGVANFADQAQISARHMIVGFMTNLGLLHRARALQARLQLSPFLVKTGLKSHMPVVAGHMLQKTRNSLQVSPNVYNTVHHLRRRYGPGENRAFFENLFEDEPDPWGYTSAYEQTKYEQTLDMLPDGPIESALEIACAEGHFTAQLAPHVQQLVAADISQKALDRTAERCKDSTHINYRQLDLARDQIKEQFDLITCSEVLYFMHDYKHLRKVAQKLTKALKPNGYLIMAHGNVVIDEPDRPGFSWDHEFGAKGIGETFSQVPELTFVKELRTPIYRVQLFQRSAKAKQKITTVAQEVVEIEQPTELPELVSSQIFWQGCAEQFPILMYHRVAPSGSKALSDWRVTPEAFENQLRYMQKAGFHSISLKDWRAWIDHKAPLPRGAVLITFDDGYRDFLEYAWPLLQKYGFSATVYLVSSQIGGYNVWDQEYGEYIPLLNWHEIRKLQAEGITFGSHSVTHRPLNSLSLRSVIHELRQSKSVLEDGLGVTVDSIAYPFGIHNRLIQWLAGMADYDYGLSCEPGSCVSNHSMLALPRIEVSGGDTLQSFTKKLLTLSPNNHNVNQVNDYSTTYQEWVSQ